MSYMSYCRFEGTRQELRTCLNVVEEHVYEEAEYEVSEREINHFKAMVKEFHDFMYEMNLLDEYGDLNEDRLEEIAELLSMAYEEETTYCQPNSPIKAISGAGTRK